MRLRAAIGNHHGDLHGYNVLVATRESAAPAYYLIDLAMYSDQQYLFYDHANFELTSLLTSRERADISHWGAILDQLSQFRHTDQWTALQGDDLGLIQLVGTLRQEMTDWVDRHEGNRLSYMESQILLARVAVGLSFVHKRLSDDSRRLALLYAAFHLKDYLKLQDIEWPKHGPALQTTMAEVRPGQPATSEGKETANPPAVPSMLAEKPGIAVMAFDNLSNDAGQEYFADGITQEIITELSRIDCYTVLSRSSTFAYKDQTVNPRKVATELGARYVVTGSVQRAGARVRITAELMDAGKTEQIWAEHYDRKLEDIFAVQDDIAAAVVLAVYSEAQLSDRVRASRKPLDRLDVWDLYQRGLWHFYKLTPEDDETARALATKAIAAEPTFAPPYAFLAYLVGRQVLLNALDKPDKSLEPALDNALKAVALDDRNSFAHTALGRVYRLMGNNDAAIAALNTAMELNPNSPAAYFDLGIALAWSGRANEALGMLDRSIRLSPKDPIHAYKLTGKAICHYFLGEPVEAEKLAREAIGKRPTLTLPHIVLALALLRQGHKKEARSAAREARHVAPRDSLARKLRLVWSLAPVYRKKLVRDLRRTAFL